MLTLPQPRAGSPSSWAFTLRDVTLNEPPYYLAPDGPAIFGAPAIRRTTNPRPLAHGIVSESPDYLGEHQLVFPVRIVCDTETEALQAMANLGAAWSPADAPLDLTVATPVGTFLWRGKPDPLDVTSLGMVGQGVIEAACRFFVVAPYMLSAVEHELVWTAGTAQLTHGYGFRHGYPHGFLPIGAVDTLLVSNAGNEPAWPTITWTSTPGNLVNPVATLLDTGDALGVTSPVGAGQSLVVEHESHHVRLYGAGGSFVDRSGAVMRPNSADFFALPPGSSTLRFTFASGVGAVSVRWRDTYLF